MHELKRPLSSLIIVDGDRGTRIRNSDDADAMTFQAATSHIVDPTQYLKQSDFMFLIM